MQGTLVRQPGTERRTLIIALLLGAAAAGLIVAFLASQGGDGGAAVEETIVVVAALDIPAGKTIAEQDIALKSIPTTAVLAGTYTDLTTVKGLVTRYPITKGEPVAPSRILSATKGESLSFQIPPGLRAFTIPVNVTFAPAAVMVPGDFVDVIFLATLASLDVPGAVLPAPVTGSGPADPRNFSGVTTLIQNVQVLAVETAFVAEGAYDASTRGTGSGTKDAKHVTLAVTPAQAQLLWLAVQQGKLTVSLRGFGDDAVVPVAPQAEPVKP